MQHHYVDLGDVRLHYVVAGRGKPVLLLHGWPQTWYAWRHIIERMSDRYTLIAPDLRGLGDSSRPTGGYAKHEIARDIWRLVHDELHLSRMNVVGHDWGGPVAYALAAEHPDAVERLVVLDVTIPGDGSPNISQGGKRWHHAFHQTLDLPELLIRGREREYFGWFYRHFGARPDAIAPADVDEYLRTYCEPGGLRAGFEYYRAIPTDVAHNEEIARTYKLAMPVLALGGDSGWGRGLEVIDSLRRMAQHVEGGIVPAAGHWIPEEQPDDLAERLEAFFTR
ncbi:MAG: alpha/beta fold hydrolase [Candidatus Eremiobacteraeota bacterium]|nr:alpha/beta fold hydrolase [Candidatus Eremiobacteraeota bacterium]